MSGEDWIPRHGANGNGATSATAKPIRVMVVDDHPAVRLGIVRLLEEQPDISIEAVCVDADCAVAEASVHGVDVAVLDYQLPGRNGLWVCRALKQTREPPAVVIFSAFADHYLAACAAVAEADAVLNKGALGSELCDVVRSVSRGRRLLPRVPQPLADMLRRRLDEPEQLLFGMLLAGLPRQETRRVLRIDDAQLDRRISAMLRTLETLPADPADHDRGRGPLEFDRVGWAARRGAREGG